MTSKSISRRDFVHLAGLGLGASVLSACAPVSQTAAPVSSVATAAATTEPATPEPLPVEIVPAALQPVLRIAHISDMHIEPAGPGREKFSRAMRNIQNLSPQVDFVINAGDCVMDALYADRERADKQWDAFQGVLNADFPLQVHHAIGNHDVWGWGLGQDEQAAIKDDPLFGKGLAMQRLGLEKSYYSFNQGGWHFIVLDSVHPSEVEGSNHPYTGKLDEEQYNWLAKDLEFNPTSRPVCIISHIPIFCACELIDGNNESSGNWIMPGAWMHIDARRLWTLFWQYPNVRLCLSGHTHQVEDLRYHGVKYMTNGAISGDWWNGSFMDFPPGYVFLSLYADGSSESEYIAY